jgi:amino acid transporter/nucleotide-binding universal stress UspA family protein
MQSEHDRTRQLTWTLAWGVVFCDIGTSVYYVPGILYANVQNKTPFFVLLTTVGFVLLALKYIEITWRNPEGGGVVTITTKAFGPMWGCTGGMLITTSYFLTAAISAVSGFQYIGTIIPGIQEHVVWLSCLGLALLAVINIIGIRESATIALVMATLALVTNFVVMGFSIGGMSSLHWEKALDSIRPGGEMSTRDMLVGFGAAWLAFSGLESISQLSPAMRLPLRRTTRYGMFAVVVTMILTSPSLTTFSIAILPHEIKTAQSEAFISELAAATGGLGLKIAVVLTASTLLLFAANTAIIGSYHILQALARDHFLPAIIAVRGKQFNTPYIAVLLVTLIPLAVVILTQGELNLLGEMYAFGLLGAFAFSSLSLDVIRWGLGRRDPAFWIGVFTTAVVIGAWIINLFEKHLATVFGGGLSFVGLIIAIGVRHGWFLEMLHRIPAIQRLQARAFAASEHAASELRGLVTLNVAIELKDLYPSSTLIAVREENPRLIQEGITRAKGKGESAVYCVYVEEWPGLFRSSTPRRPNETGRRTLALAIEQARLLQIEVFPIWTVSYNAAEAIASAARNLGVDAVFVGSTKRSIFYHMLRGHVVKGLMSRLPYTCHLMICN